jgi:hypothetical protein
MRGSFLLVLLCCFVLAKDRSCNVVEFERIGYEVHTPIERQRQVLQWLDTEGKLCSKEQLTLVWNELPTVMGAADTMTIRSRIAQLYERAK